MFDLAFDVPMAEYQENMDILMSIFDTDVSFEEINAIEFDGDASTSNREALEELNLAFSTEREENFAAPNPVSTARPEKRFKTVSETELNELKEKRQSKSTRKNTKWGVKLFQEWSLEALDMETNFENISVVELDQRLGKFYAEAAPKQNENRSKQMSKEQASEYTQNSFKSIRSAINRHLQDLGRDLEIVRCKEFRSSNNILDGKLKKNLQEGLARPTKHKEVITNDGMSKISSYLYGEVNPIVLRFRVWFIIAVRFVSRGLEFHQQLRMNSFVLNKDENGNEYVTLSHETKQKNWQGGIDASDNPKEKRMYAIPSAGDKCPVKSLLLFMSKTDPNATSLFNRCSKPDLSKPDEENVWYNDIPLKPFQFTRFMADISKHSKCTKNYTAHCLRATAIQNMNDAGFEIRHIMHMSGHHNESSVRSYNRDCSTNQKKAMSDALASGLVPLSNQVTPVQSAVGQLSQPSCQSGTVQRPEMSISAFQSSNVLSSGFISNSSFNNCVFNFGK